MPDLFDPVFTPPTVRRTDPVTSHDAAASVTPSPGRIMCLSILYEQGPMTDHELSRASGIQINSIGKRRQECTEALLVGDTGKTRPSPSGRQMIVWAITLTGMEFLRSHG